MVEFHSLDFFRKKLNCKLAPIVICDMFLGTLRISWNMNNFFNWKPLCMSTYNKGKKVFSKYIDKGLPCLYVHGYCKIVNVLKILIYTNHKLCDWSALHVWLFFHMINWWLHIKNWHLVYSSYHFLIIINCYLSCVFFMN
jgi:hypothetical protein